VDGYEPSNSVLVDRRPRENFELFALPGEGRHSIALALAELISGCLALVGLGIWSLRLSSVSSRVTVRRVIRLVVLVLATIAATFAIGHSATILWSTIPIVW
jgi:hypothetical protein